MVIKNIEGKAIIPTTSYGIRCICEVVNYADLKIIRPDDGFPPSEMNYVIGKKLIKNVKYFQPVTRELFTAKV
tara:strand:+ start:199 stop:417 length:219 start_codon:yes stop_codon:yes gene_type:complete